MWYKVRNYSLFLFVSVSSAPVASSFSIWISGPWLLIEFSLNWEKFCSNKSPYGSNFTLFLLITFWTPCSCSLFRYSDGQPGSNYFPSLSGKKCTTWWDKNLFGMWYWRIHLTFLQAIVSFEIINLIFGGYKTLQGCCQSNNHLIHQANNHRAYSIYFQVCNMLIILRSKNRLIYRIFH